MPGQQQVCPKPLAGKVFYLDLPSNRRTDALENDIKLLGGTVEKFFSKEIRYLVSNKREAKYVERLRRELAGPSPDSGQSSPFPCQTIHKPAGSHKGRLKGGSKGQAESVVTSRGKLLVERVVKEQEMVRMDKTLSDALEWGVKVLYIDDVITYVEKKKKEIVPSQPLNSGVKKRAKPESKLRHGFPKLRAERIGTPFIKVEDLSRHYRPIYAAMSKMPELNTATAPPCTPFCVDKKDPNKHGNSEESGHSRAKKNRDKKQVGFCECCMVQYDDLIKHVQSESHLAFSKGKEYLVLDKLVSTMKCDLAPFKHKNKRPKCSVSSTVAVLPGAYRTELHNPQVAPVTGKRRKSYSIPTAPGGKEQAMEAIPVPIKTSGAESNLRNIDRTLAQPLPYHKSCRADSVSDQTSGQFVQTPTCQGELAPSRGNSSLLDSAIPSRLGRTITSARTGAMPQHHKEESQSGCSSRQFPHLHSPQKVMCERIQDSLSECPQNEPVSREQEASIPECQEVNLHEQMPSPVRTIQRKVKVQKRKRRRVDTVSAFHNQVRSAGDKPEDSFLYLWQLFHSSDHKDLEFLGFDDEDRGGFPP